MKTPRRRPTISKLSSRLFATLSLSLLLASCATHPVACVQTPRAVLPVALSQESLPPPGAFQKCLAELLQGQTSGQACNALPAPPTP